MNTKNNQVILPTKVQHLILNAEKISIDSRTITDVFGRQHKNVLVVLDSLIADSTISRLEFKPRTYMKRGKKERCIELDKSGFLKAMPFIGGKKAREGQKLLVNEFMRLEKALAKQSKIRESEAFQLIRSEGKDTRKLLVEEINKFIEYAKSKGSNSADKYYGNITNLLQKSLVIIEPKATGIRDLLSPKQLSELQTLELIAIDILKQGNELETPYKQIYQQIKTEVSKKCSTKIRLLAETEI